MAAQPNCFSCVINLSNPYLVSFVLTPPYWLSMYEYEVVWCNFAYGLIVFWNALQISNQVESYVHFSIFHVWLTTDDMPQWIWHKKKHIWANNVTLNQWCVNKQLILIYQCLTIVDLHLHTQVFEKYTT